MYRTRIPNIQIKDIYDLFIIEGRKEVNIKFNLKMWITIDS